MTPSPLSLALASLLSLSACQLYFDGDDDPPPHHGYLDAGFAPDGAILDAGFVEDACGGPGNLDGGYLIDGPPPLDGSGPPIPPIDAPVDGGTLPSPPDGGY